jgi:hypothetical protein
MTDNTLPPLSPDQQQVHDALMELYDLAEELVETVDNPMVQDPEAQLSLIEPLIESIEETAGILHEEYTYYLHSGKKPGILNRKRMENAMRTLFLAIKKGKERIQLLKEKEEEGTLQSIFHGVTKVMDKLSEHLEKVFSLLQTSLGVELKNYRYSRAGRQEGLAIGGNPKGHGTE